MDTIVLSQLQNYVPSTSSNDEKVRLLVSFVLREGFRGSGGTFI